MKINLKNRDQTQQIKRVVMFSGGAGSWMAARRVADKFGTENMVLLFADTMMEDEDLYRFLKEASANIGVPITRLADGRTPWEVFRDVRFIGNSGKDPCSMILKRELLNQWREKNCHPDITVTYFGIDWTEEYRIINVQKRHVGWKCEAPLCEQPLMSKRDVLVELERAGISTPRLYGLGFPHNNCGGFCIKAGHAHFALLLKTMPERYAFHEQKERELREMLGDYSILRDRTGGVSKPLTLEALRKRIEAKQEIDKHDWGGCGCALE